eukprot:scaffold16412_cov171-Amphora_coffeaeformis.AAC.3
MDHHSLSLRSTSEEHAVGRLFKHGGMNGIVSVGRVFPPAAKQQKCFFQKVFSPDPQYCVMVLVLSILSIGPRRPAGAKALRSFWVLGILYFTCSSSRRDDERWTVSASSSAVMDTKAIHRFTTLASQGRYEQAARHMASNAIFSSPRFAYKSRAEWLQKFPDFHKKAVAFDIGPLEAVGDNVFVRRGKVRFLGIVFSIKEVIELNDDGKIVRSQIRFC